MSENRKLPPGFSYRGRDKHLIYRRFSDERKHPKTKYVRVGEKGGEEAAIIYGYQLLSDWRLGKYDPWTKFSRLTLEEAVQVFMDAHARQRASTQSQRRAVLKPFIRSVGGDREIQSVSEKDVAGFFLERELTESTVRTYLDNLSHFFKFCIRKQFRSGNPAHDYREERKSKMSLRERKQAESTPREIIQVHEFDLLGLRGSFRSIIEVAMSAGLRRTELAMLNRNHVRLASESTGTVEIKAWSRASSPYTRYQPKGRRYTPVPGGPEEFVPKTGKDRTVLLTPRAVHAIRRELERWPDEDPMAPVFRTDDGFRWATGTLSQTFKKLRMSAGLSAGMTFHSSRHSYVTMLYCLRISPFEIMELTGHSSLKMVHRYAHLAKTLMFVDPLATRIRMLGFMCPEVPLDVLQTAVERPSFLTGALFAGHLYGEDREAPVIYDPFV